MRIPFCLVLPLLALSLPAADPPREAARLPAPFVENLGQWPDDLHYALRRGPWTLLLRRDGWDLRIRASARADLRMRWEGRSGQCLLEAERKLPGAHNFFVGRDPARWRAGARGFGSVRFLGLYPGVDARIRFENGRPEYDLLLAPGADLSRARLRMLGASTLALGADGALLLATAAGAVRQPPPVAWTEGPDGRRPALVRYVLLEKDLLGFAAPRWDGREALIIDPWFEYASYLGGSDYDTPWGAALDLAGIVTVAGETDSLDFPVTAGALATVNRGNTDAFVARFDPAGAKLLFATYLGGTGYDSAYALAVDPSGAMVVAGFTDSLDFPATTGAYDTTYNGGGDAFAARLAPAGNVLLYCTYLGGSDYDTGQAIHTDAQGVATLSGTTSSTGFPVTPGAYDTTHNGQDDAFLARLDPAGTRLIFSTFIGGTGWDSAWGVDVDLQGRVTLSGDTDSGDFPVTPGALKTVFNRSGYYDTFVTRLDGTAAALLWSTYLGGEGNEYNYGVKTDGLGRAFVTGATDSTDFPTTPGAWSTRLGGIIDAYVASLEPTGAKLSWSTYLGGSDWDFGNCISVDLRGIATVAGETDSLDFPTTPGAPARTHQGGFTDAFLTRFGPAGERLAFSTYLGGNDYDSAWGVAANMAGQAAVACVTYSGNLRVTAGAFDPSYNGNGDAWVARLRLELTGVTRYGTSVPACLGQPTAYVLEAPRAGNQKFGLACTGAPPSSGGVLLIGAGGLAQSIPVLGIELWVNVLSTFTPVLVLADAKGESSLAAPIPAGVSGARLYFQYLWINTATCGGAGTLSSSDALDVLIQ